MTKKTKTFMDYFYAITANLHFRKKWPLSRASPKFVKCPKKDSVIKVSLESDLLFSVEI